MRLKSTIVEIISIPFLKKCNKRTKAIFLEVSKKQAKIGERGNKSRGDQITFHIVHPVLSSIDTEGTAKSLLNKTGFDVLPSIAQQTCFFPSYLRSLFFPAMSHLKEIVKIQSQI